MEQDLKSRWQRSKRGWSDTDIWSIDTWFCDVVPGMLRHLADTHMGTPIDFAFVDVDNQIERKDSTNWPRTLRQMADDLEAVKRHDEKWFYGDNPLYSRDSFDQCTEEEAIAYSKVKAGLVAFTEYFHSLWD